MKKKSWYKLDNAAKIYPAISSEKRGSMFSLSAVLTESIDGEVLNEAVNIILERFPTFKVKLKRGVFWYYLEENRKPFYVSEEPANFLRFINENETNDYLFKVFYYNKKITLSIFHCLTDGTGGMEFLKALVFEYLVLKGKKIKSGNGLKTIYSPFTNDENNDHFLNAYDKSVGAPEKEKRAFQVTGTPNNYGCSITTISVSTQQLKSLAKSHNATITAYVCGLLMYSIYHGFIKDKKVKNKLIKILVPVNMRNFYKTNTVRNFALFTRPQHDFNSPITLEECINLCSEQIKTGASKENLDKLIYANVKKEKNWFMKFTPLFIKDIAIKIGYHFVGDILHTSIISNLGKVDLPDKLSKYIDEFIFSIGTSFSNNISMSIISYNDTLNISFSKNIVENDHEKIFVQVLTDNGINVQINSNYWEEIK